MNRPPLHLDGETRSTVDLPKCGAYVYFDDPSTDIWCVAYSFGDDPSEEPELWLPGEPCPEAIVDHVINGGLVYAWNVAFERLMWEALLATEHGWPMPEPEQFRCTMSEALAQNLPGKLEQAAPAIGLDIVKDNAGHRLMLQMSKPRRPRKDEPKDALLWWDDEDRKQRLYAYCKQDVRTEKAIASKVLRLRPAELEIFLLDARINSRGVYIDANLCRMANVVVKEATSTLNQEMKEVTDYAVSSVANHTQLTQWLKLQGVDTDSVAKDVIEDLLIRDDISDDCRRALELRQEGAKTSTAKIAAMLRRRQKDGRMRGNLQYYGAGATGRWAARGAQLQNLTRPVILKGEGEEFAEMVDDAVEAIMSGNTRMIEMMYDQPLTLVSDCIRSMICAPDGRDLLSSDYSNIEGRIVAWLAGQEDKLEAFRAFDRGEGPDLYLVAASGVFGLSIEDSRPYRQIGKVSELSLGYQGGPRAFAKMGRNYGMRMEQVSDTILDAATDELIDAAKEGWPKRGRFTGMRKDSWMAAEVIKLGWREKNNLIRDYWNEIEDAAVSAVSQPGEIFTANRIKYRFVRPFLFCQLPSGRMLCYPYARLEAMVQAKSKSGEYIITSWKDAQRRGLGIVRDVAPQIRYKSLDQFTRKWKEKAFYGGLGVENVTQAIARDVMAEAMLRVEEMGYEIVLTVHDEIVAEVDKGFGDLEEFNEVMAELPKWCPGLPITVAGWRGKRYRKG